MTATDEESSILKAAQNGDLTILRSLTRKRTGEMGRLEMCRNSGGDTPLLLAARHGHAPILQFLHEELSLSLEQANADQKKALHEAAGACREDCVRYLLSRGAQVDSLKRADWTPFMLACTKRNLSVIEQLLSAGTNWHLVNKDGWNGFHIACREGCSEIVDFLLTKCEGCWKTVSHNGRTPLHSAALNGAIKVVQILLKRCEYGADDSDSCGVTPLMDATRAGQVEIMNLLIHNKASVEACDLLGRQPAHHAAQAGEVAALKCLVEEHCADASVASHVHGMTPLHYAAKEGQVSALRYLLEHHAEVNARDSKGRTALHLASIGKHVNVVHVLLGEFAAKDQPDNTGKMARDFARSTDMLQLFSENRLSDMSSPQ